MVKLVGLFSLQHNHTFVRELFPESLGGLVGVDDIRQIDIRIRFVDEVIELLQHLHHRHLRVVEITVLLDLRTESGQRRMKRGKEGRSLESHERIFFCLVELLVELLGTDGATWLDKKKPLFISTKTVLPVPYSLGTGLDGRSHGNL